MDEESTHWNPLSEEEEKLEEVIEEEETETWLENLGLSQDALPSISKKKRRSDPTYQIDRKSKSLVYVEDRETQALLNFLLNSSFAP
ncbi:protein downstream neighbor of Son [Caerostris extrusa]|uniref:Protein downstream neighbor of Son n=1 Tax=Caerostris extrusa TaxID=172846 RepID=A0AAV4VJ74_CAEEX|nr:protein downstream neighbor of Son [Caerostris extrusa]